LQIVEWKSEKDYKPDFKELTHSDKRHNKDDVVEEETRKESQKWDINFLSLFLEVFLLPGLQSLFFKFFTHDGKEHVVLEDIGRDVCVRKTCNLTIKVKLRVVGRCEILSHLVVLVYL
jgi:hypothetical protein